MPRATEIMILKRTEQPILYIQYKNINVRDLGSIIGPSFMKIAKYLNEIDEIVTDIPFVAFPGYEHMDENNMEVMIGFPVSDTLPEKEDIRSGVLPESKIAFCFYRGSYADMIPLYAEMAEWIEKNGYKSAGTAFEYYYNGPEFPEDDHLTKVVIPLK